MTKGVILASGSQSRQQILSELGYPIKKIAPQETDETPLPKELPRPYVKRITQAKLESARQQHPNDTIFVADTIAAVGRRILQKAQTEAEQADFMKLLSGRRHLNITHIMLYHPAREKPVSQCLVETLVQMKRLTAAEVDAYVRSGVWQGCSAYRFDWLFQSFVKRIDGSVSSIAGLPVYETKNLLESAGFFVV